jgi:hypothetical protein
MPHELRKNTKYPGYYKLLDRGHCIPTTTKRFFKEKKTIPFPTVISNINCEILSRLTSSTVRSPVVQVNIKISAQFKKYLQEEYLVTNKFTNGCRFLIENNLEIERFFNETDYCTISDDSFMLRLPAKRKRTYKIDKNLKIKTFKPNNFLSISFTVEDGKI